MLKNIKMKMASLAPFAAALFLLASTTSAQAQLSPAASGAIAGGLQALGAGGGGSGMTLGDVLCNAVSNASSFSLIFSWISYIAGAIAALRGIYYLRLHADDPRGVKMHVPMTLLGGSAALLALPSFVDMVATTAYNAYGAGGGGGGSGISCQPGGTSSFDGLDGAIVSFISNISGPMVAVVSVIAAVVGLFFILRGLMKASQYGFDPKANSVHSILTHFLFGAILFTIGANLPVMIASLFGTGSVADSSVIQWDALSAKIGGEGVSQRFITAVTSALTFIQVLGAIAFLRGWLILKKVVEGGSNASLAQGLTHLLGGVAAINIFQFLVLMDQTFGINLIQ